MTDIAQMAALGYRQMESGTLDLQLRLRARISQAIAQRARIIQAYYDTEGELNRVGLDQLRKRLTVEIQNMRGDLIHMIRLGGIYWRRVDGR